MQISGRPRVPVGSALIAACVVAMAGCSGAGSSVGAGSSGRPLSGGVARVGELSGSQPTAIFPIPTPTENDSENTSFRREMYTPLFLYGANDSVTLDSADSVEQSTSWSPNGRTVVVTLKKWKWSDGETTTAQDAAFFLNLLKVNESDWADYVPPNAKIGADYFPDDIVSVSASGQSLSITFDKAYNQAWMQENWLSGVTPIPLAWDRTSATATGSCAQDAFGSAAASKDCAATYRYLASESTDSRAWASSALWSIVDGPFRLKSFNVTSGAYSLVPDTTYSGSDRPHLSEIDFVPFTSDTAEYAALKAGSTSRGALQVGEVPAQHMPKYDAGDLQHDNPLAASGYYFSTPIDIDLISAYYLNDGNPAVNAMFEQEYFIRALQDTVDQQGQIDGIANGWGYPTDSLVPTRPAGNPISPSLASNKAVFDLSAAKALLAAHGWDTSSTPAVCVKPGIAAGECGAGVKAGQKAAFTLNYGAGLQAADTEVTDMVSDAAQAGIAITPDAMADTVLGEHMVASTASAGTTAWEANWYGSWVYSGYPSGEYFLASGAGDNIMSFSDPALDKLIYEVTVSSDTSAMYAYEDYTATHAIPMIFLPNYQNTFSPLAVANGFHVDNGDAFGGWQVQDWYYAK